MRSLAVVFLTVSQFTAFPFLMVMATNTLKHETAQVQTVSANVTTIYKSAAM